MTEKKTQKKDMSDGIEKAFCLKESTISILLFITKSRRANKMSLKVGPRVPTNELSKRKPTLEVDYMFHTIWLHNYVVTNVYISI